LADAAPTLKIRAAHSASKGTYGAPRIHAELIAQGVRIGKKRIARLMRAAGLAGVSRRRGVVTTWRDGGRQAPDLVDRNFTADRPNVLWVADITYVPTWAGLLYLAVVLDAFSRRIVGRSQWAFGVDQPRHSAGARCSRHGARPAPADGGDPPFRPGIAIHLHRVWQALPRGWRAAVHGIGG
jgi:putative transposase